METDERLQRIEGDIHERKADMSDIKGNVAKITATIESPFPHLATTTPGKPVGAGSLPVCFLSSPGSAGILPA